MKNDNESWDVLGDSRKRSGVSKHTTPILKRTINFVGSFGNIRLYSLVLIDENLYKALVRDS